MKKQKVGKKTTPNQRFYANEIKTFLALKNKMK